MKNIEDDSWDGIFLPMVKNMTSVEVYEYIEKIMKRMDFDNLRKEGYLTVLTPTRRQDDVTMEIL